MGEESCEMHYEDDKTLLEKNKKRIVKTRAQVEALEKFYNEHKYPSETMKLQVADSTGLTEKQVSGWFCHRRLKDKKLTSEEKHTISIKQDRSSGVIQDRVSGLRQDSCCSTKQGDNRNLEMREVESERLTTKEFYNADLKYDHGSHHAMNSNRLDSLSSGSSSSMSDHQGGVPFDAETSMYLLPKFHLAAEHEKARPGPAGYLKFKGRAENGAITAVKWRLGKHYREDGPPLGVEFDSLPPGAFESSTGVPVEETYDAGEDVLASPDESEMCQNSNFDKDREFKPRMAFENCYINERGIMMRHDHDIHDTHTRRKCRQPPPVSNSGFYYPRSTTSVDLLVSESRNESGVRPGQFVEVMRTESSLGNPNFQPYGGQLREERAESQFRKYNDVGQKVSLEKIQKMNVPVRLRKAMSITVQWREGCPDRLLRMQKRYTLIEGW